MTEIMPHKKELLSFLGNLENLTILDYGCGAGDFINLMLPHMPRKIHAVDGIASTISDITSRFDNEITNGIISTDVTKNPSSITDKFDRIICHNVLECIEDKIGFVNKFNPLLASGGVFLLSHHDFDSAIYNSQDQELTRNLIHHFSDTKQNWQEHCDGQMGRKIPGIIEKSVFKGCAEYFIIRKMERLFIPGSYGYLMAEMLVNGAKEKFEKPVLERWYNDLGQLSKSENYYFAIDLVVSVMSK